jgi:Flp pilus assembly protein protease CpaA
MDLSLIFLPFILFLGIITSYTDIKQGKIKNKTLLASLIAGTIVYILIILSSFFNSGTVNDNYFITLFLNTILALATGIVLWHFKLWSAADAKLFAVYAFLIPLSSYSSNIYNPFPAFTILMNTFVPFFMFYTTKNIFLTNKKLFKKFVKKIKLNKIIEIILSVFIILWIPQLIFELTGQTNFLLILLVIIISTILLRRIFQKNLLYILIIISLIRIIFDYSNIFNQTFINQIIIPSIIILVIYILIIFNSVFQGTKIKVKDLKPGMILGYVPNTIQLENPSLTVNDVKKIKKHYNNLNKELKIQTPLSFAPFMFLGVLLTILLKGDFLLIIGQLFLQ